MDGFEQKSELRFVARTPRLAGDWLKDELEDLCFIYKLELSMKRDVRIAETRYQVSIKGPTDKVELAQKKIEEFEKWDVKEI